MPILTTAGVLQGGLISDSARQRFVDDTNSLLLNGTGNFLFGAIPPAVRFEGNEFLSTSFNIQPLEQHVSTFSTWHKVFIDTMFQGTANALDIDGATPLSPVLDYTIPFVDLGFDLKQLSIPDFAIGMALPDPTFQAQLEFFFDVNPPDITPELLTDIAARIPGITVPGVPKLPQIPTPPDFSFDFGINIPRPPLPTLTIPPLPPLAFSFFIPPLPIIGFLLCAVVNAVPAIFATLLAKSLAGELITALEDGPIGLMVFVLTVIIDAILSCLGIELKNVLTFLAGFLVYIERLAAMLATVLVGVIFGEGLLVTLVAQALRLV